MGYRHRIESAAQQPKALHQRAINGKQAGQGSVSNQRKKSASIRYVVCTHCKREAAHGIQSCPGCEAGVSYGTPLVLIAATVAAAAWLRFKAHRFFYDSWLLVLVLAAVAAGGMLSVLCEAFDERVVFRRRRRCW